MIPTYLWKVNSGRIVKGKGTSKIEVDLKEAKGEKLTATVIVRGFDPSCPTESSCSSEIKP
jgi:hypothetical protein